MLDAKQHELRQKLIDHGFVEAAKEVRRFTHWHTPVRTHRKIEAFQLWESLDKWPWPQWDRKSEKDWYAVRADCPY